MSKKYYCCCCGRQITKNKVSNDYECPMPCVFMGPGVGYCCADCSVDLDNDGLFPEERERCKFL